jgi:hypothetical protein
MVVALSGTPVLVVLSEKHDVSRRVSAKLLIPISDVVFMGQHYPPEFSLARWANA